MKQEKPSASFPAPAGRRPDETNVRTAVPAAAAQQEADRRFMRKRWLLGGVLVFFLFSVIFIIPAGKIPGIRSLVAMMGFSALDAQSMSFGRALLTWAGEGVRLPSSDGSVLSVFDKNVEPGFNPSGPDSGLFDLAAVNASRRARGLRADMLAGAYAGPEDEENRGAVSHRVGGWSRQALADQAQKNKTDVYFGADADLAVRAASDASNGTGGSSDTARLLPAGNIVGSVGTDWLGLSIDKASSVTIGSMDKELETASNSSVPLNSLKGTLKAGGKPQRDLARVWLMSGAANKARQLMLKKQLASAGYVGMEMPKKVYDSMGEKSGVTVRGDELMASFEDANRRLLSEEQCRDLGNQANSNVGTKIEESRNLIRTIRATVPTSCEGITAWKGSVSSVKQNCRSVKDTFSNMNTACGVKLKSGREGSCETVYLDSYASDLSGACEALAAAKAENPPDEDKIAALEAQRDDVIKGFDRGQLDNTFNLNVDGTAGGNDFFPETEANSSWLAE